MIEYQNNQMPKTVNKYKKPIMISVAALIVMVAAGSLAWWWQIDDQPVAVQTPTAEVAEPEAPIVEPQAVAQPDFDKQAIKDALADWTSSHSGTYAVVITDKSGKVIAEQTPDKSFFAASLYKLYVAYEGYRNIDDGTHKLNDPYLSGWTRQECLDKMIRESHSPCAEKLWVELGKDSLDAKMKTYGLTNTSMTSITTSAHDAAVMLARIEQGQGLKPESRKKFLASMEGNIYDDALKKGFANQTVYDKVGFREKIEYHDVGIIKFDDDRVLIVSVLTQNVGTQNIVGLSQAIATAAKKP